MSDLTEVLEYHDLAQLQGMTLDEVHALWELVPTDRQRMYKATYDRARRDEGVVGSDSLEAKMAEQFLERYAEKGLVPVGSYWTPTPPQIQDLAKENGELTYNITVTVVPSKKPSAVILLGGVGCGLILVFLLLRGVTVNGTKGSTGPASRTPTATLARTYTPTPLALDVQDAIIRGSSNGGNVSAIYPVNLRVLPPGETQPRIFVVQRRAVNTAEWIYEDNPDVASSIAGLLVRPVLGIPWSEANAELFKRAVPGSILMVQMNTGITMRFVSKTQMEVDRGEAGIFVQDRPGLTIVLIGERNVETGEATANRWVLLADYLPDEPGSVSGIDIPAPSQPTPTVAATPLQRVDVQVISVTTQPGQLVVGLWIFNGRSAPLTLDENTLWIAFGYAERADGPHIPAEIVPLTLEPGQAMNMSVIFGWQGEPFATISVADHYRYNLTLK